MKAPLVHTEAVLNAHKCVLKVQKIYINSKTKETN